MEHPKPTDSTIYKLYGSSQRCAFPNCSELHIEVDPNTGIKICNTEVCHIHARREYGPRWDASQSSEENRSDGNLVLLCRKHHSIIDDRRNEDFYTPELLRAWKAKQEAQGGTPPAPDDIEAIKQANVIVIAAETVNLGGEGGSAPSAGGGGGAAIGSNAQGGRGGDGGRIFKDGRLADASALKHWPEVIGGALDGRRAGAGGGGAPAIGDDAFGGRGGDGGDIHTGTLTLQPGTYPVRLGRGARLPGELGGPTYMQKVEDDGSTEPVTPKAGGGLSGDSHMPDDVPEIDVAAIERGVRVCCLTVVEEASIENGTHSVRRFGLSACNVRELPAEIVFSVLTAVTKRSDERVGYFVSLVFDGEEKARIAVGAKEQEDGYMSWSSDFLIGAYFETDGLCRIIAHASGILLCETAIEIRLTQ